MPDERVEERPPYLSLTTFTNFLERLGAGPIPPRIDKSALENYSGAVQSMLMTTLRAMGFIDEAGNVRPELVHAAQSDDARKAHLGEWAARVYKNQLVLAQQNGTSQMLQESFAEFGYTGSTLRKAIVFYLALVDYLGLPNSPHFRAPRQPAPNANQRRRLGKGRPPESMKEPIAEKFETQPRRERGETRTFDLGRAATVTLTVEARWLELPLDTMTRLRQVISDLEALVPVSSIDNESDESGAGE